MVRGTSTKLGDSGPIRREAEEVKPRACTEAVLQLRKRDIVNTPFTPPRPVIAIDYKKSDKYGKV